MGVKGKMKFMKSMRYLNVGVNGVGYLIDRKNSFARVVAPLFTTTDSQANLLPLLAVKVLLAYTRT